MYIITDYEYICHIVSDMTGYR